MNADVKSNVSNKGKQSCFFLQAIFYVISSLPLSLALSHGVILNCKTPPDYLTSHCVWSAVMVADTDIDVMQHYTRNKPL